MILLKVNGIEDKFLVFVMFDLHMMEIKKNRNCKEFVNGAMNGFNSSK